MTKQLCKVNAFFPTKTNPWMFSTAVLATNVSLEKKETPLPNGNIAESWKKRKNWLVPFSKFFFIHSIINYCFRIWPRKVQDRFSIQESVRVGCIPPALKPHVFQFQLPPLVVARVGGGGGGAEINKLEQVSSDHHQMSLATGGAQGVVMSTLVGARNASNEVKYRKRVHEKIKGGLVLKNELVLIGGS